MKDQRQIILMPLARRDINEIWRYIANRNSEFVANIVVGRIAGALDVLAASPLIGRLRTEYPDKPRSFPVRSHMIFYVPLPNRSGIAVWRILHGARDLRRLVRKPEEDS